MTNLDNVKKKYLLYIFTIYVLGLGVCDGSGLAYFLLCPSSHSFLSDAWLDKRATGQELIVTKVISSALLTHTHMLSDHLCSQGYRHALRGVAKAPAPTPTRRGNKGDRSV